MGRHLDCIDSRFNREYPWFSSMRIGPVLEIG
jgi:hypothetical protein